LPRLGRITGDDLHKWGKEMEDRKSANKHEGLFLTGGLVYPVLLDGFEKRKDPPNLTQWTQGRGGELPVTESS